MANLRDAAELHAATQKNLVDFLQTDLALCSTFVGLVKTELDLGAEEAAERVYNKAEQGHATIERFLPRVEDITQRQEIGHKLIDLRSRLDALKTRLKTGEC